MATLAETAALKLQSLISNKKVVALTNQDDSDVAIDAALLAEACSQAAAKVMARLGLSIDGTDAIAVDLTTRLALLRLSTVYSMTLGSAGMAAISGVYAELEQEAVTRRQAASQTKVVGGDFSQFDRRFPGSTWDIEPEEIGGA